MKLQTVDPGIYFSLIFKKKGLGLVSLSHFMYNYF